MAKQSQLNQDVTQWLANNNINHINARNFADPYSTQQGNRVSTKWSGIHLTKDQANDLEFTLSDLGHDIHFVRPSTKPLEMYSYGRPYYTGFRVIRNV